MSRIPPPLPIQPLAYSPPAQEVWGTVVRVVAVVAGVWAAMTLFTSACQIGMAFVQPRVSFGLRFNLSEPRELVGLVFEGFADIAAVITIVASVQAARSRSRGMLLTGLIMMSVAVALQWALRTVGMFFMGSGFLRDLGTGGAALYLMYTFGSLLRMLTLPTLLIWVLTRPVIRQHFDGSVSPG